MLTLRCLQSFNPYHVGITTRIFNFYLSTLELYHDCNLLIFNTYYNKKQIKITTKNYQNYAHITIPGNNNKKLSKLSK